MSEKIQMMELLDISYKVIKVCILYVYIIFFHVTFILFKALTMLTVTKHS